MLQENKKKERCVYVSDREKVLEFYRAFQQDKYIPDEDAKPAISERVATLKLNLIAEEFIELVEAVLGKNSAEEVAKGWYKAQEADEFNRDVVEAADATADLRYVIAGFDIEAGIDSDAVFAEVHASNMSKLDANGQPILSDGTDGHPYGKILKSDTYFKPDISSVLRLNK